MINAKMYAKIMFKSMSQKLLILPSDRIGIRLGTEDQPFEAIRMQPNIHSVNLPEPFATRYQTSNA